MSYYHIGILGKELESANFHEGEGRENENIEYIDKS